MAEGRFALKAWHIGIATLIVFVAVISLYFIVQKRSVEQRLKALRAAGYPTDFAELSEYNRLPVGTPNAASVYERAFWQYRQPVDEETWKVPIVGTAALPRRGLPLPQTMADVISPYLASNQPCLRLLHEAGTIGQCRYNWDYTQGPVDWNTTWGPIRSCAWLLELSATYHAYIGDPNGAAECIEDGLRLADSLQREPGVWCHHCRIACLGLILRGLERSMNATAFTDAQLREMDQALATAAAALDLTQALITERCFMLEACRDPSLPLHWSLPASRRGVPGLLFKVPGVRRIGIADTLDRMEDCIAASKLPPPERLARFRALEQETRGLSFLHVMVKSSLLTTNKLGELHPRFPGAFDLARTALAVERYRVANNRLPEELGQLVPQYLDHVPPDPFDGQPLRYRRTEPGYVIYNVAEDGQDNGGTEPDSANRDRPYDWCFTVAR
jgi:hypothetical protein